MKKKRSEPIAIVAQSCLLPGCRLPEDLWNIVRGGRVELGPAPEDAWRIPMDRAIGGNPGRYQAGRAWSDIGGYIVGFDTVFDPGRYSAAAGRLDPMMLWSLHCAAQCLDQVPAADALKKRTSVIMGNLAFPNTAFSEYVEATLFAEALDLDVDKENAVNRFMAAGPARTIADELSLGGKAFCLDAACASSLYAIKIGCDLLQRRQSDMVLAGAVNCTDSYFLHVGFCALEAKSGTGQSRPFHKDADGLVPAEGAAFIGLKRLDDAMADGDRILGVIRGIGLSNDGRAGGFLAPVADGQVRAMAAALEQAGLDASDISLLECHATGTSGGDKVELDSVARVYGGNELVLSSLKANLGHLITVSGVAGLQKVLGCMEHTTYPPTPNAFPNLDIPDPAHRVLNACEAWEEKNGRRIAAISNFGFGGNNAHLIVEQWNPVRHKAISSKRAHKIPSLKIPSLAVLAVDIQTDKSRNPDEFAKVLDGGSDADFDDIAVDLAGLNFPPHDLRETLGQQLLMMQAGRRAMKNASVDPSRLGIYIGMDVDPDVARYAIRGRMPEILEKYAPSLTDSSQAAERIAHEMVAATFLGCMPNIPANRLNSLLDAQGPGFTVADDRQSGITALEIAAEALLNNEIDAALIGAVDMGRNIVHQKAMAQLTGSSVMTGDAAVALLIKRSDALGEDEQALFHIGRDADGNPPPHIDRFGYLHAVESLFQLAANGLLLAGRAAAEGRLVPQLPDGKKTAPVTCGQHSLSADKASGLFSMPVIATFTADGVDRLMSAIRDGDESQTGGPVRLAIVCEADELETKRQQALQLLAGKPRSSHWHHDGIIFSPQAFEGELAFAFTGAAAAYANMARDLLLARPDLVDRMGSRLSDRKAAAAWVYENGTAYRPGPFEQLTASSFICQLHAEITLNVLNLRPDAMIGLSSGETNGIFALGAWPGDIGEMFREIRASGMYRALANSFDAVRQYLQIGDRVTFAWENWRILTPVSRLREALETEEHAYMSIINHDNDAVFCGTAEACARILDKLGRTAASPLGHEMAVHCEVLKPFEDVWYGLHHRNAAPVEDIRFYSNWFGGVYQPDSDHIAAALTGQAVSPIDFRKIVEQAWQDGVRIFVEHGPRNNLSHSIRQILGKRPHLAVALDSPHESSRHRVANAAAELWCAGYDLKLDALAGPRAEKAKTVVRFPMHMPAFELRDLLDAAVRLLPSAPELAPVNPVPVPLPGQTRPVIPAATAPVAARSPGAQNSVTAPAVSPVRSGRSANQTAQVIDLQQQLFAAQKEYLAHQQAALARYLNFNARLGAALAGASPAAVAAPPIRSRQNMATPPPPVVPPAALSVVKPSKTEAKAPASTERPTASEGSMAFSESFPGPAFSREELIRLASGRISDLFGPKFLEQDQYAVVVRMPEPPLLLCDRVLGIEGEAGAMGRGTIWTETDVTERSYYLHHGRMPAGYMIEAGQADLLLISWLGIDKLNKGERAYRLLGCEMTFHGDLPEPGDTLRYDIHVDGHAVQGDVRLFFFHYDCRIDGQVRLSVRSGQAGFFTRDELDASDGVLWAAETAEYTQNPRLMDSPHGATAGSFTVEQLKSLVQGDLVGCFGPDFMPGSVHTRTPTLAAGRGLLLREISDFDPHGGPEGRGYLRCRTAVSPDDWFFSGHFKNDPCMPGTLMAEACQQAMAFYLIAHGHTLHRDGWRFQPVKEKPYAFTCRGQVLPESRQLVYEVFVDECYESPFPTLKAHVLCTVDGLKAFLCEGLRIELVPDYPISSMPEVLTDVSADTRRVAHIGELPLDYHALMHCAIGDLHNAFGPAFKYRYGKRSPRLPGLPYHFMTRVTEVRGPFGRMSEEPGIVVLYDMPADAWYFKDNPSGVMPWCVLMEIGLQPCGWLASYVGCTFDADDDLLFRNLDGTATQYRDVLPTDATIQTRVTMLSKSTLGKTIIVSFHVECSVDGEDLLRMDTTFGFFPPEAFIDQKGLAPSGHDLSLLQAAEKLEVDFKNPDADWRERLSIFPRGNLLLLDRIDGYDRHGGREGKGWMRGRMDIRGDEWFFKAHFYQDPVQPGSLGIEAMVQTMQAWLLKQDHHKRFDHPVFEPVFLGIESEWHYRGQVVPSNENVTVEIEVLDEQIEHDHVLLQCVSRYWVDGLKIYEVPRIGIRIKAAERKPAPEDSWILSIEENPWIKDHCPTYVLPCMPMMGELDMLIFATQKRYHQNVAEVRDLRAVNWLRFEEDTRHGRYAFEEKGHAVLARLLLEDGEVAAEAEMHFEVADMLPYQLETLQNPIRRDLPYPDGTFHGPSFQLMTEWRLGTNGASASIQVESRGVPVNAAHPSLLDASLHCIPHDNLTQWDPSVPADQVAYPIRLNRMRFFAPWPKSGSVKVEARYCGLEFNTFPKFRVVFHGPDQNVLADYELLETLLPLGHLGAADGAARRRYLHFKAHVPGLSLAREDRSGRLALNHEDLARVDWLPGTLKRIYGIDQLDPKVVLQKEVVSSAIGLHPKDVCFDAASTCRNLPFNPCASEIIDGTTLSGDKLTPPVLDTKIVDRYWERRGAADSALLCVTSALCGAFVRRVILQDPDDFAAQDAVLFLANHQVGVESLLFLSLMAVLKDQNMLAVAKAEHRDTWVGAVLESAIKIFGDPPLEPIYFQRERQKSFVNIMKKLTAQKDKKSVLIHVEGTRARQAGVPVRRATSLLADLSMRGAMPIVPVRFVGGLNTGKTEKSLEFPYRYGMQDIYVGRSIRPDTLSDMTLKERKACIVDSINLLGPPLETEAPIQGRIDASSIQARLADGWKAFPAVVAAAMELSSSHRMLERLNRIGVGLGATDLFALLQQQIHPTVA